MRINLLSTTTSSEPSRNTLKFALQKFDQAEIFQRIVGAPLSQFSLTKAPEKLSWHNGFIFDVEVKVDFFCSSDVLYTNMKVRLNLIRDRSLKFVISISPNVSLGSVGCLLHTQRLARKGDFHKKTMDVFAYITVDYNYIDTPAEHFTIFPRRNSSFRKTVSTKLQLARLLRHWR